MSDAAARSLGSLWGTAKFVGKTALGLAHAAVVLADASRPGNIVGQMQVGEAVINAPGEVVKFVKETPDRYRSALAKAGARSAQGDHFGAGDVFTEEFTAPVATAVVGALEGGVAVTRLGGRALARATARAGARDAAADAALAESGVSEARKAGVLKEPTTGAAPVADPAVPSVSPAQVEVPSTGSVARPGYSLDASGRRVYEIPPGSTGGPTAGKPVSPRLREDLLPSGEPAPVCSYCRFEDAKPVDHVKPRVRRGNLEPENTTPACTHCNSSKSGRVAPKTPPPGYSGDWAPAHWPQEMIDWWCKTYGGG